MSILMRLGNYSISNYLVILATAIACILLSGQVKYWLPENSNMDLNKYLSMAEAFPNLNTTIIKPFVYRIIAPWLAGSLPFAIPVNFYLLNFIFLILFSFVFLKFLIEHKIDSTIALVLTIAFQMNKYFFQFLSWNYFQLSDTIALLILFSSFILIKRKNWFALVLVLPISILVKEYALIIIPADLFYFMFNKQNEKDFLYFSLISGATIAVYLSIKVIIDTSEGVDLLTQDTTREFYYSRGMLFLKKHIASFTPFGLLPILFYKELILFFRKNTFLFREL